MIIVIVMEFRRGGFKLLFGEFYFFGNRINVESCVFKSKKKGIFFGK